MSSMAEVYVMMDPHPTELFEEVSSKARDCCFVIPFVTDPDIDLEAYNPDRYFNPLANRLTLWGRCLFIDPIYIGWVEDEAMAKEVIIDEITHFREEMMAVNMGT